MSVRVTASPVSALELELAQLRRLEIASIAEATTLLLLVGVAVPLKHFGDYDLAVRFMGPVHGLAFVTYVWLVVQTVAGSGWRRGEIARLLLVAVIPFGGFLNVGVIQRWMAQLRGSAAA